MMTDVSPPPFAPPPPIRFIETLEYRRFAEFCDACRKYRYIGLCYGPPGVGKTLSARRYTRWDEVTQGEPSQLSSSELDSLTGADAAFYTAPVATLPQGVFNGIGRSRAILKSLALEPLRRAEEAAFIEARRREQLDWLRFVRERNAWALSGADPNELPEPVIQPFAKLTREFIARHKATPDPTQLLIVDEADRLNMRCLDEVRSIFDRGCLGLVLIGMPGIEKRMARYAQFYSRIGFVHEFRVLSVGEVRKLFEQSWTPTGMSLPPLSDEILASVIRITSGNFRLLNRLLTQIERILEINGLTQITPEVVNAARESLVIGQL